MKARYEWNTAFYGKSAPVNDILTNRVRAPGANAIRRQLSPLDQ